MAHACATWAGVEKIVMYVLLHTRMIHVLMVLSVPNVNVAFGSRWKAVRNVILATWIRLPEHATNVLLPGRQKAMLWDSCAVDVCLNIMAGTVNLLIQRYVKLKETP